jgi:hypothetical protein
MSLQSPRTATGRPLSTSGSCVQIEVTPRSPAPVCDQAPLVVAMLASGSGEREQSRVGLNNTRASSVPSCPGEYTSLETLQRLNPEVDSCGSAVDHVAAPLAQTCEVWTDYELLRWHKGLHSKPREIIQSSSRVGADRFILDAAAAVDGAGGPSNDSRARGIHRLRITGHSRETAPPGQTIKLVQSPAMAQATGQA